MQGGSRRRQIVPLALGAGMMAIVIAAALAPLAAPVPAQSECPYGVCPNQSSGIPLWAIGAIIALVLAAALILGLFYFRRRRRPGPPAGAAPEAAAGPYGPGAPAAAAPAYLETPEDVGAPPPAVPAEPPATPPEEGTEADIDSLMRELDKISNEILKKSEPGKTEGAKRPPPTSDDTRK